MCTCVCVHMCMHIHAPVSTQVFTYGGSVCAHVECHICVLTHTSAQCQCVFEQIYAWRPVFVCKSLKDCTNIFSCCMHMLAVFLKSVYARLYLCSVNVYAHSVGTHVCMSMCTSHTHMHVQACDWVPVWACMCDREQVCMCVCVRVPCACSYEFT